MKHLCLVLFLLAFCTGCASWHYNHRRDFMQVKTPPRLVR